MYYLAATAFIQHQQKELLEKGYSKTYHFTTKDVEWVRSGKEIRVKERMMDVFNWKQVGGILEVTGIWDDSETALQQQIQQLPATPANSPLNQQLITLLFTPCLPFQPFCLNISTSSHNLNLTHFPDITTNDGYSSILIPPPRYSIIS